MSVLTRLAGALLVAGLATGVVLRVVFGRRGFRPLLAVFVVVPATLHSSYVLAQALPQGASPWGALAFLAGAAAVVLAGWLAGRRWLRRRRLAAASTPLLVAATYGALPLGLYSLALRRQAIDLDVVSIAAYLGVCLFGAALLLPFAVGGGGWPAGWLGGRGRRR